MTDPPSPYLPDSNIRFAWDSTCLAAFKKCPRYYYLSIVQGWRSNHDNVHLRFGAEYQKSLEHFAHLEAQGIHFDDAVREVYHQLLIRIQGWNPDREDKYGKYKNPETLRQLVIDRLDHYRDDPATTYILEDGKPAVELSFRFELDCGPGSDPSTNYLLCGHLDRVVKFNSQLMILDHKTTMHTISSAYFDQWEPQNQMTLYTLAGKVVLDAPIRGVIVEAAQILLTEPHRFVRGFTYRTQDQLEEWLADTLMILDAAEACAIRDQWPMNDTACQFCTFRGICSKSPSVREKFLRADFTQTPEAERWNPLISRG